MASGAKANRDFSAEGNEDQSPTVNKGKSHRGYVILQALARILAMASAFIALGIMLSCKQSVYIYGFEFYASYSYSSAFRFLMVVDAVVGALSAVSLVAIGLVARSLTARRCFYLFAHDLVVMLVMMSGASAGTAVGLVGKYGEEKMGWMGICDNLPHFCYKITLSIVFSYVALFSFMALVLSSAANLMSRLSR